VVHRGRCAGSSPSSTETRAQSPPARCPNGPPLARKWDTPRRLPGVSKPAFPAYAARAGRPAWGDAYRPRRKAPTRDSRRDLDAAQAARPAAVRHCSRAAARGGRGRVRVLRPAGGGRCARRGRRHSLPGSRATRRRRRSCSDPERI